MDVRTSRHTIAEQTIEFTVVAPTVGDLTTRRVTVTDEGGQSVVLYFGHDDFQLFESILKEF